MNNQYNELIIKNKELSFLKSFNLMRELSDENTGKYTLSLELVKFPYYAGDVSFKIIFKNVFNLKIIDLDHLNRIILDIEDVHSYQIEDATYRVKDMGDSELSFYCSEFEIL